jgi:hypothetical protein
MNMPLMHGEATESCRPKRGAIRAGEALGGSIMPIRRRVDWSTSPMRILLKAIVTIAVIAASQPSAAAPARDAQSVQLLAQSQRPRPDDAQRPPQRDFRRAERPPESGRREGRLTDEERRDLRRDIDRANREIYKGR